MSETHPKLYIEFRITERIAKTLYLININHRSIIFIGSPL